MYQKSLKLNAFLNIFKTVVEMAIPFITIPYVSRVLLPTGMGKVNFAFSIYSYFSILASMGINTYAIRECAKIRENKLALNQIAKEIFFINVISTLITYVLLFISILSIPKLYESRKLICIYCSNILFLTLGMDWIFNAVEDYFYSTVRSICFRLISLILLFVFIRNPGDYLKYALINVAYTAGVNVSNFIRSRKFISLKGTDKVKLKKHLRGILVFFAFGLATSIFTILDTSMLGFMTSSEQVGYYSSASKLIRLIRDLFPAVFTVLTARLSFYVAVNKESEIKSIFNKSMNFILCFSIPISIGIIILSKPLVLLVFGDLFLASVSSVQLMAPIIVLSACSGFLGGVVLVSQGKETLYLIRTIIAAVCDVILNFIFIPKYGSYGASLATTITEALILFLDLSFLFSFIKELHIIKNLLKYIISAVFMGIVVFFFKDFFSSIIIKLLFSFLIGVFIYGLFLLIFKNDFFIGMLSFLREKLFEKHKKSVF